MLTRQKIKKIPQIIKNVIANGCGYINSYEEISGLKNVHKGERCFIIGNGPSLLVDDLEKIKNDKTFSSNRVYKIFENTEWRPTYYCVQDYDVIRDSQDEIIAMSKIAEKAFIGKDPRQKYKKFEGFLNIRLKSDDFYPELPKFSSDARKYLFDGWTVSYMALQLAVYMGFSEIYLLGIDHSYSVSLSPTGDVVRSDVKDHFAEEDKIKNVPALYKTTKSYEAVKKYADEHEIKIYNATRGGKLEVFERVDFDDLVF